MHREADPHPCQGPTSSRLSNLPFKNSSFSGLSQSGPFSWDLANPFLHAIHGFNRTFVNTASSMGCCYYVACSQTSKRPKSAWKAAWKQSRSAKAQLQKKPCYKSINAVFISKVLQEPEFAHYKVAKYSHLNQGSTE